MKIILETNKSFVLQLQKGEELISSLSEYCKKRNIFAGNFTAIGAADEVTVSFYNLETKKYQDKTYSEDVEILTVVGNIALLDDEIKIHAHGSFADETYSVFGGHVQRCVISATGEIHLTKLDGKMTRKFDEKTGLFLLSTDS